jgi:transcriptional regulator with XRE-family HTH domain
VDLSTNPFEAYERAHGRGALAKLAEKAGVAPARLYEIKRGHVPKAETAKKIAAASDGLVFVSALLRLDDETVTTIDPGASGPSVQRVSAAPEAAE